MKKLIKILVSSVLAAGITLPGLTTELPKEISGYIKSVFPKASIRFDGLIELPDGTKYLPVFPINFENVEKPTEIVKSIPANATLTSEPDLVLFANNFSLLKIISNPGEASTLISSNDIPLKVKLGILPQDLLVPENLVIPPELRVILGDLKIPVKGDNQKPDYIVNKNQQKNEKNISYSSQKLGKPVAPELKDLVDKTFYVTNYQSNQLQIVNPQTGRTLKNIVLSSIPSSSAITDDGRYLLITCLSSNKVSIIDTTNNSFLKELPVGQFPDSILIIRGTNKAYIANKYSSDISVVDLLNMEITSNIKVTGMPDNLTLSEDQQNLFYNDALTGKIYSVDIKNDNQISQITQANNVSKLAPYKNFLFILSRTDNTLLVYDLSAQKLIKTIEVGNKPVDIKVFKDKNKLFVLSAGSDTLTSIDADTFEVIGSTKLNSGGFPKNITILPNTSKAIISNVDSYEILLVDLNNNSIISKIPISTTINSLVISPVR